MVYPQPKTDLVLVTGSWSGFLFGNGLLHFLGSTALEGSLLGLLVRLLRLLLAGFGSLDLQGDRGGDMCGRCG